jgi:hypothetical protein
MKSLNEVEKTLVYFKVFTKDLKTKGFQYNKGGLNQDTKPFMNGVFDNGLFFTDHSNWKNYVNFYGDQTHYAASILIPPYANTEIMSKHLFKSDKIIIHDLLPLWDYIKKYYSIEEILECSPEFIKYIGETSENKKLSISLNGRIAMKYFKEQDIEICRFALEEDSCSLAHIENQSYPVCYYAIKKNSELIHEIKNPTLCMKLYANFKNLGVYKFHPLSNILDMLGLIKKDIYCKMGYFNKFIYILGILSLYMLGVVFVCYVCWIFDRKIYKKYLKNKVF